jgi:hypothetical protein
MRKRWMIPITAEMLEDAEREMSCMTDSERIERLRRGAERLRIVNPRDWKNTFFTPGEMADMMDDRADRIEAGEIIDGKDLEEEESPEELLAGAKAAKAVLDLLRRYDVGTLGTLFDRFSKKKQGE